MTLLLTVFGYRLEVVDEVMLQKAQLLALQLVPYLALAHSLEELSLGLLLELLAQMVHHWGHLRNDLARE